MFHKVIVACQNQILYKEIMMKVRDLGISLICGVLLAAFLIHYGFISPIWAAQDTQNPSSYEGIRPVAETDTDPFSWQIKALMLDSHRRWQTLQAEAVTIWYLQNGEVELEVYSRAQINDADIQVRFEGVQSDRRERYVWLLNDSGIYETNSQEAYQVEKVSSGINWRDYEVLPRDVDSINTNVIYRHPAAASVSSPVSDFIYPVGFAQRANGFALKGEDVVAGRQVWIVEWMEEDPATLKQLFWVDQETGTILKAMNYIGPNLDRLSSETVFTNIVFNETIPATAFEAGE